MKILISGDRRWSDIGLIKETLAIYDPSLVTLCYQDFVQIVPPANELGIRTEHIDNLEGIDYLLIFHKYIRGSVRSKVLIKECSKKGISYQIVGSSF